MPSVPAATRRKRSDMLCQSALCGAFVVGAMLLAGKSVALPSYGNFSQWSSEGAAPGIVSGSGEEDITLKAQRTIIEWSTFNINSGETVQFFFNNRGDIVLNRTNSSVLIDGVLTGRIGGSGGPFGGNVWIYSPGGIVFGAGAQVDVGGLLATTALNSSDASFLDTSNFTFDFAVTGARDVVSKVGVGSGARITGHGGTLAFIAPEVDTAAAGRIGPAAQIGGPAGAEGTASVLYGAATAYRVRFVPNSRNDLDLFDFIVPTGGDGTTSTTPLNLQGVTNAGNVYLVAVNQANVVNAVIQAPGTIIANAATGVNGDIVLTGGSSIVNQKVGPAVFGSGQTGANIDPTAAGDLTVNTSGMFSALDMTSTGGSVSITAFGIDVPTISAAKDVTIVGTGTGSFVTTLGDITAGDDIRITSNRDVTVASADLTGLGPDSEGDGQVFSVDMSGAYTKIDLGAGGTGFLHGATTATLSATGLEGDVNVDVADSIDLTSVVGRTIAVASGGNVKIGSTLSDFSTTVTATGSADITSARSTGIPEFNDGVYITKPADIIVSGSSVNIGTANSAADVVAHATGSGGSATVGSARAGDDILVVADAGSASLTSARLTGLGPDAANGTGLDADGDGNRLLVSAAGAGHDAFLGLGTGKVSGGADWRVQSDRDAIVDLLGDEKLTSVIAGRDATVTVAGNLTLQTLQAGDDVRLTTSGLATLNDVNATGAGADTEGDGSNVVLTGRALKINGVSAADDISATATNGNATVNLAVPGNDISLTAANGLADLENVIPGSGDVILTGRTVNLGILEGDVGRDLIVTASVGGFNYNGGEFGPDITAARNVVIDAKGAVVLQGVTATTGDADITGSGVTTGDVTAGGSVTVNAPLGSAITGVLSGGVDVSVTAAGGGVDVAGASAGRDLTLFGRQVNFNLQTSPVGRDISITATSGQIVAGGDLNANRNLTLNAGDALVLYGVSAGGTVNLTGTAIGLTTITAGGDITGTATAGAFDATGTILSTTGDIKLSSPYGLHLADVTTKPGDVDLTGLGVDVGAVTAGGHILGTATGGDFTATGNFNAGGLIDVSGRNVTLTSATAGGNLTGDATVGGFTATGDLTSTAGDVKLTAAGALQLAGVTATLGAVSLDGNSVNVGAVTAGADIAGTATADFAATGALGAGGAIDVTGATVSLTSATAGGTLTGDATGGGFTATGALKSNNGSVNLTASGALQLADVTATLGAVNLGGNTVDVGAVTAGTDIAGTATGDFTATGALDAGGKIDVSGATINLTSAAAGGTLTGDATGGDFVAAGLLSSSNGDVNLTAKGALTLADVTAATGSVGLTGLSVGVGAVTAGTDITGAATGGGFTATGALSAGRDAAVTATGAISLKDVSASSGMATLNGASVTAGAVSAAGLVQAGASSGDAVLDSASGQDIDVSAANGFAEIGTATAGRDLTLTGLTVGLGGLGAPVGRDLTIQATGGGFLFLGPLNAGRNISINVSDLLQLGPTATAGGDMLLTGGTVSAGGLTAGGDVIVKSTAGYATVLNASAGDDVRVSAAGGSANLGSVAITGAGPDNEADGQVIAVSATGAGGDATLGFGSSDSISGATSVTVDASRDATVNLGGAVQLTRVAGGRDASVTAGSVDLATLTATAQDASVIATTGDAAVANGTAGRDLSVSAASGLASLGAATAGQDLTLKGASASLGAGAVVGRDLLIQTTGAGFTANGDLTAGRNVTIDTAGDQVLGDVTGTTGSVALDTESAPGASIAGGQLTAGADATAYAIGGIDLGSVNAGGLIAVGSSGGPVHLGGAASGGQTTITGTGITLDGDVTAGDALIIQSGADLTANGALASTSSDVFATATGAANLQGVTAGGNVVLDGGALAAGQVTSGADLYASSRNGDLILAGAKADDDIYLTATGGSVSLGSATLTGAAADLDRDESGPDADGNGQVLSMSSDIGDVLVGLGTGGITGATEVDLAAGRDVIADLTGSASLTTVNAGRNAQLAADILSVSTAQAGGDLSAMSRTGDLTAGQLTAAGGVTLDAAGALTVAAAQAGADLSATSRAGGLTAGQLTAAGGLTVDAAGLATLGAANGDVVTVMASDLDIGDQLQGRLVTIQSRTGNMTLGDGVAASGLTLTNAEFSRISASENLSLYAGLLAGGAQGDMKVGDLGVDTGRVPLINLLAGGTHTVSITGAVTPLQGGGRFVVGDGDAWKPQSILISGSIGSTTGGGEGGGGILAFDSVQLSAVEDILMGAPDFIAAAQAMSANAIDVAHGRPNTPLPGGYADHVFVAAASLTVRANGKIVQQNTSPVAGRFSGLFLTNRPETRLDTVLTIGGDPPTVVDLFGSFVDKDGNLITGQGAALSKPAIALEDGLDPNGRYRFNGCPIFEAGGCIPEIGDNFLPVLIFRPDLTVESLTLTSQDATTPDEVNPDITGAGNEEIWRKRRP